MLPPAVSMYLLAFCRVALGLVFLVSSLSKVRDLAQFQHTIRAFHLLPPALSGIAAILFLGGEAMVVVLLIIGGPLLLPGFVLGGSLLLVFSLALVSVLVRKIQTPCHCFGTRTKVTSPVDVWRNSAFILCALGGCVTLIGIKLSSLSLSLFEWVLTGLGALVFVVIWIELGEIVQLFRQG